MCLQSTTSRCVVITLTSTLIISGNILVLIGLITLRNVDASARIFFDYTMSPLVIITSGCISFFVGWVTLHQIHKNPKYPLMKFVVTVFLLLAIQITGSIFPCIQKIDLRERLMHTMATSWYHYDKQSSTREMWEYVQADLDCCGFSGSNDYILKGIGIPYSCCGNDEIAPCLYMAENQGCYQKVYTILREQFMKLVRYALSVTCIQIIIASISFHIIREINKKEDGFRSLMITDIIDLRGLDIKDEDDWWVSKKHPFPSTQQASDDKNKTGGNAKS